jgi:HEAT repeat protein
LIAALQHIDPDIRRRAAAALRVLGNPEAVFALARALERERNPEVREHLSAAIEFLGQDKLVESLVESKNVPGLIEMLSSPRPEDVIRAAKALGEIGNQRAAENLIMVFRNPLLSNEVRLAAAEALLKLKSAPTVVTLLAALRKKNWRVRHNAAAILGQLNATWATDSLIKALDDEHALVRQTSASALSRFNNPKAQRALSEYRLRQRQGKTAPLPAVSSSAPVQTATPPGEAAVEAQAVEEEESVPQSEIDYDEPLIPLPAVLRYSPTAVGAASDKDETLTRLPTIARNIARKKKEEDALASRPIAETASGQASSVGEPGLEFEEPDRPPPAAPEQSAQNPTDEKP